jgi:hypothetical protein
MFLQTVHDSKQKSGDIFSTRLRRAERDDSLDDGAPLLGALKKSLPDLPLASCGRR